MKILLILSLFKFLERWCHFLIQKCLLKLFDEASKSTARAKKVYMASIVPINSGPRDWYYKTCKKCSKKVDIGEGQ
ncbi:hypothetical protein PIB30_012490 [Stylosanthes scabra]|uniref:Uncharacterized protein n=1 Tax=Stylosanthes scabra TaxID=79078 RepID=A0ABU6U8Y5_9FABA|nr:hypothetical protein [Stylosanthes scabra]